MTRRTSLAITIVASILISTITLPFIAAHNESIEENKLKELQNKYDHDLKWLT